MTRVGLTILSVVLVAASALTGCARRAAVGTPAEELAAAWNDYRLGEFDRAQFGFEGVTTREKPGTELHLRALYGLATTWNLRRPGEDAVEAAALYREILRLAPTNDLAAWSQLALARMQHLVPVGQEPDYPVVRKAYQEVIDRFPMHLAGEEAFIYQQSTLLLDRDNKDEARQALAALRQFVQAHAGSRFISPAYRLMSVAHQSLGEPDETVACLIKAFETTEIDHDNPIQEFSGTYWSIAATAEFEAGDFATARRFYQRLIAEYPVDQRVQGARDALKRMGDVEAGLGGGGTAAGGRTP